MPEMPTSCHGETPHAMMHHEDSAQMSEPALGEHGEHEANNGTPSCCADNCSMLNCSTASVLLASFDAHVFVLSASSHFFVKHAHLSSVPNSLFRPPIIG